MSGNEIFITRPCGVFVLLIRCQRALANYKSESITSREVAGSPRLVCSPLASLSVDQWTDRPSVPADGLSCDISQ